MSGRQWTRRKLLRVSGEAGIAVAALAGAGYTGFAWPHSDQDASQRPRGAEADVEHYRSRPDLRPPRLTTSHPHRAKRSPGDRRPDYQFLSPKGYPDDGPGQQGLLIADWRGRPVWFLPTPGAGAVPFDLRVQRYQGNPVLTWWQGTVTAGHGDGVCKIFDTSYQEVATVRAGHGLHADLHEFQLTPQGTALVTAYRRARADTSAFGMAKNGWVYAGVVQEIDVATGAVLFEWDSLDHVPVHEGRTGSPGDGTEKSPLDYFHVNSIDTCPDGDLLVSSRNTWALYKIARPSGKIVWRMGGPNSDFRIDEDARCYWQHDARVLSGKDVSRVSLFDNGSSPPKQRESRGVVLDVDHAKRRVHLRREYRHPAGLLADNQGSVQVLADGRAYIGWGAQPYVSEFSRRGTLLVDTRFPANDQTYRAFALDWTGRPTDTPTLAVGANNARGTTVYVSWNGATEVDRWRIMAGESAGAMAEVATVARRGFETAVAIDSTGPFFSAVALDTNGTELSSSKPVQYQQ